MVFLVKSLAHHNLHVLCNTLCNRIKEENNSFAQYINPAENYKISFKTQKTYGELILLSNEILFFIINYFTAGEKYYEDTTILIDSLTGYNSALACVFDRIL